MRSECQFFMSAEDKAAFLRFAQEKYGLAEDDGWLVSKACPKKTIQFEESRRSGEDLTAGRISLVTEDMDRNRLFPDEAPMLEKVYRGLRSYIRKTFNNKLVAYTGGQRSKYTYRNLWLGPQAEAWLAATPGATLRHGTGFHSNFVPEKANNADASSR